MNCSKLAGPRRRRRGHCGRRAGLDAANEAITAARQRFDQPRFLSGFTERLTQFLDGCVQAMVKIHERIIGPELLAQLFAGDQISWMLQKNGEYSAGLRL